ncbi:MAG TPA: discoidin domain-containing protein [Thermoanaerobaculia bacterium]|jgi:hypothetical protein
MRRISHLFVFLLFLSTAAHAQNMSSAMTWTVLGQQNGYVHVGADGQSNVYSGDTTVDQYLPVLCVNVNGLSAPGGITFDFYNGWLRGSVQATEPVQGVTLSTRAAADRVCSDAFGAGWRMAEFHDGRYGSDFSQAGGWTFWGAGSLPSGTRFWASINDQKANPWNSVSPNTSQALYMLQNLTSPLLSFAQNPNFQSVVRNGVSAQFDGDDNVLLSDVIWQAESWGAVDPYSSEWQSFVSQVNAFGNVNGETYYPQIYIPHYGEYFPSGNVTVVVIDPDPNVESVPAYQFDGSGYATLIGYVDESYAMSNEVWVLSLNERVGMDAEAFRTVRQLDAMGVTSRTPAKAKSFVARTESLACNPTGLRNNNGAEYINTFRIPNLSGIESWLGGKVEPRAIVVGKGGIEIGNKYWGRIKRDTIRSNFVAETKLVNWDRATFGDWWVYKWVEEDFGPKLELSLGLGAAIKQYLGVPVTLDIKASYQFIHNDLGYSLVNFNDSTYTEYSTGALFFTLCSVGGDGHTGDDNLARAATVAASSTYSGYSPQRVNDGDRSTALGGATSWCNTGYGSGYPPQWLQLDFGVTKTFNRVVLYTSSGYALRDYDVQYFTPTGWVTVAQVRNNTALQVTSTFGPVSARIVRILTLSGPTHQPGFTRINELEVY